MMGGTVIKTEVPVIESCDFKMFLIDCNFRQFDIFINPKNLFLVVIFTNIDDAIVYKIKDLESKYSNNKPYYFEPDLEFEKALEKKYDIYSECNEYYLRKYNDSFS